MQNKKGHRNYNALDLKKSSKYKRDKNNLAKTSKEKRSRFYLKDYSPNMTLE